MKAQETTFERVLGGLGTQFRVPLYQRPYTWTRKEWEPLWRVVVEQAAAIAEDGGMPGHFLGSVVLAPGLASAGGPSVWLVVDGQQRLTTLSLLLCALRDRIRAEDPQVASVIERNYLINEMEKPEYRWKLLPTQLDRPAYQACLDGAPAAGNMGEAYRYFQQKLLAYDDPDDPNDLRRVERAITRRLELVEITADQRDNVHRIFESLNHTGRGLTQADLLRNYVFMLLPKRGEDVYRAHWQPMERTLDEDSALLEDLAWLDLVIDGNSRATRDGTYEAHRERLRVFEAGDEAGVAGRVADLARRAGYLRLLYHPDEAGYEGISEYLQRFIDWDTDTADPALMVLLERRHRGSASDDEVVTAMQLLESFLVRRMLCGVPTNNLNRILNALPGELWDGPVVERLHTYLSRERHYWPNNETLRAAVAERNFYWSGRRPQRSYVLRRLEDSYGHKEPVDWEHADVSVEHVMPQTLSPGWRADLRQLIEGDEPLDDVHRSYLHTLGNLTLTGYNSELSNSRFDRKKLAGQDCHGDRQSSGGDRRAGTRHVRGSGYLCHTGSGDQPREDPR